jgi:hypothetical protein
MIAAHQSLIRVRPNHTRCFVPWFERVVNYTLTMSSMTGSHRSTSSAIPLGSDPLDILRKECAGRKRCDPEGRRLKTTDHWSLSIAVASSDAKQVRQ